MVHEPRHQKEGRRDRQVREIPARRRPSPARYWPRHLGCPNANRDGADIQRALDFHMLSLGKLWPAKKNRPAHQRRRDCLSLKTETLQKGSTWKYTKILVAILVSSRMR